MSKIPQTKRYSIYKNEVLKDTRIKKLNFEPDGRVHYVYRITDYTRTEKEHYYGSRSTPKHDPGKDILEDFWSYKTSSKYNTLNENNKENYKVKIIRKDFSSRAEANIYEAYLHQYFDVKLHDKFWNEGNQTPFGFDTTGKKNATISEETRKKMSEAQKGKKLTEKTKKKLSVLYKGKSLEEIHGNEKAELIKNKISSNTIYTEERKQKLSNSLKNRKILWGDKISKAQKGKITKEETKQKLREANLGKKLTEETKKKISEKMKGREVSDETKKRVSEALKRKIFEVRIFDLNNELKYTSYNSFIEFCKNNNLPYNHLKASYRSGGKPIKMSKMSRTTFKNIEKFEGWYAKKI